MALVRFLKMPLLMEYWSNRALISTSSSLKLQQRFKSHNINCKSLEPKCGDRFKAQPCNTEQLQIILPQPAAEPLSSEERYIKTKYPSICCGNPCADAYPRFDLLYYKRANKLKRQYQQTWAECPEPIQRPKVKCFMKTKYPKWKKRPRHQRPPTACEQSCASTKAKCPHLKMPGCVKVRYPPNCRLMKSPQDCRKRKAPYPSFSECSRKPPRPRVAMECSCLCLPSMCEIWSNHHYIKRIKKIGLC